MYVNAYAGCGRSTLNCIGRFWLESVRSASKLNSRCTQMNYEMNSALNYAQMYRNVLQCTPNGPTTLASAILVLYLYYSCQLFMFSTARLAFPVCLNMFPLVPPIPLLKQFFFNNLDIPASIPLYPSCSLKYINAKYTIPLYITQVRTQHETHLPI